MNLSEILSHIDSTTGTVVSLVLFLAVFVAIAVRTLKPSAREELRRAGNIPLEDGADRE